MNGADFYTATLIVTAGAVAFALAVILWAYRFTEGARNAEKQWRKKLDDSGSRVDALDAVVNAFPGGVMVWEEDEPDPDAGWGQPKLLGAPAGLANLLALSDASEGPHAAPRILDGLADFEAVTASGEASTLRKELSRLRTEGVGFALRITLPAGRVLKADGGAAAGRVLLWLADEEARIAGLQAESGRLNEDAARGPDDPAALQDVFDKAPHPVWRMSSGLKLQYANPAFLDAVEAASLDAAITSDLTLDPGVKEQAKKALAVGARIDDTRAVVAGGARRHYAISIYPVSGGAAGVAIDMTRSVEAREALERHVRAQDDALNHLDDAVAIFGPNKGLVFHNRALAQLFGLDEAWLETKPMHGEMLDHLRERRLVPEHADYPKWKASELERYGAVDKEAPDEEWDLPDGRRLRVARVRHPLGGLVMIFGDLTEEITLRTQFNAMSKVQRFTLEQLTEGVAVFGSDGRLRLFNRAFEEMWGFKNGVLEDGLDFGRVAEACLPLFHDRDEWARMKARITDPTPEARQHVVGEMRRSNDTILTYVSRPLPDGSTMIAFSDVTASRSLAEALETRNEALESANKLKSDFVGHVSYQLRAPLTTILGYGELLEMALENKFDKNQSEQFNAIITAANQLSKLIEDILDIGAIDADTMELDSREIGVRDAAETAIGLIQRSSLDSHLRIVVDCASDAGSVFADPKRLKQILYNLVQNAVEHTPEGGSVTVGARRAGGGMDIWVEDTGEGIAPEDQARIFEAFQSGRRGGAGLGLTLVREFMELHSGYVDLESQPGVGTRVTCHFPPKPPGDAKADQSNQARI